MQERNQFGFATYEIIKIDENRIYWDGTHWVVEKYDYSNSDGIDMYSVVDGFELLSDAIDCAFANLP